MTLEEAKKLARIIGTADNACSNCVEALVIDLNKTFPEFKWETGETKWEYFNYTDDTEVRHKSLGNKEPKDYDYSECFIEVKVKPG